LTFIVQGPIAVLFRTDSIVASLCTRRSWLLGFRCQTRARL